MFKPKKRFRCLFSIDFWMYLTYKCEVIVIQINTDEALAR